MLDANPPAIYRTPADNIEWTFHGTFPDNGKLEKFRYENECRSTHTDKKGVRIRYHCYCRASHGCKFMLVAMKTIKQHYHVYKHGQHCGSGIEPTKDGDSE
jgi:hypothetical protein